MWLLSLLSLLLFLLYKIKIEWVREETSPEENRQSRGCGVWLDGSVRWDMVVRRILTCTVWEDIAFRWT